MTILDDPAAVEAIRILRQHGYSARDVMAAWTADLPQAEANATRRATGEKSA